MADTTITIDKTEKNGFIKEHEIYCEFDVSAENDGIGDYEYWGVKGYDKGTDYAVLDGIYKCCLIRSGRVERKEDAPACAYRVETRSNPDGSVYYYWYHKREISPNDEIEQKVEEYIEEADLEDLFGEPDYEDYYERKNDCEPDWDMWP